MSAPWCNASSLSCWDVRSFKGLNTILWKYIKYQCRVISFQNVVCLFCPVYISRDIKNPVKILLYWIKYCLNLNEILHISDNIESTKKAEHILEMPRLGVFDNYYLENFTSKIRFTKTCRKSFQGSKTTFVLLLQCFVGHLVPGYNL